MKAGYFCFVLILIGCLSCQKKFYPAQIEGKRLEVSDQLESSEEIETFIQPYRDHVKSNLDSIISYAPQTFSKKDGDLNTAIGNLMADATYAECNPVFKKRTGKTIDFVLLNYGGIRSIIPKGDVTIRTAYEVMPFENAVVVVELRGYQIEEMLRYLSKSRKAHPVSKQIQITLNSAYELEDATIHGKSLVPEKHYFVATNDYLYNGGDYMTFFKPNAGLYVLDYKIRSVLIDHFKKSDTLKPVIDNRFVRLKSE